MQEETQLEETVVNDDNSTGVQPLRTLKMMKQELVDMGMPQAQVDNFNTKAQVQSILNTMKAREAVTQVDKEERVKTLEENETPAEKKMLEKQWRNKAERMKQKLMAQPMIRTILPLQSGEKPGVVEWRTNKNGEKYQVVVSGSYETVQINGFKWIIPKGTPTDVPEQVSKVLDDAYLQTQQAGAGASMDRIDPRTGRQMSDVL